MTEPNDPDNLRIGANERELAVSVLHEAVGGGYLNLQEFEERSTTVYAAKTRGDLWRALGDLPGAAHLFPATAAPGVVATGAVEMSINWSTVKRRGPWDVPGHLLITGSMGTADLDLGEARIMPGSVIEVAATWSTVKLQLGGAVAVDSSGFRSGSGSSFKDKAGSPTMPGGPIVRLVGGGSWSTVVLKR